MDHTFQEVIGNDQESGWKFLDVTRIESYALPSPKGEAEKLIGRSIIL
jgi:hypothetical protein